MHDFLKRRAIGVGAMYLRHSPWLRGRYRIGSILLPWLRRLGPSMGKRIVQPVIVSASTPMVSQMAEWLLARGYRLYRIEDEGLLPLNLTVPGLPDQYNVLACQSLPAGLAARILPR